jgi:hypothetical protein
MQHVYKELVQVLIQLGNKLETKKLLSTLALSKLNLEQSTEALRYLEHCVYKLDNKDVSIHNYLISLYIKYEPQKLLDYIKSQQSNEQIFYDKYYALRQCLTSTSPSVKEACVYIYKLIGEFYRRCVNA